MIESAEYPTNLASTGLKTGVIDSADDRLPGINVASPPEFGGPPEVWSPEHLYVASISSCLMTTFRSVADNSKLNVLEYSDDATGYLKRGDDRLFRIESVTLRPKIVIDDPSKIERAHRLIEKAESVCLISRSVDSRIDLEPEISVRS